MAIVRKSPWKPEAGKIGFDVPLIPCLIALADLVFLPPTASGDSLNRLGRLAPPPHIPKNGQLPNIHSAL